MRLSRVCWPAACVLAVATLAACAAGPARPAGSAPTPTTPPAGPALPTGPGAGPPIPSATTPFARLTPGVVSASGGVQQVLVSGVNDSFQPGVISVHPGRVHVIFRNDDSDVHNLIFQGAVKGQTVNLPPGQADTVDVTLSKPGLYDFVCSIHELVGMRGQVKVS